MRCWLAGIGFMFGLIGAPVWADHSVLHTAAQNLEAGSWVTLETVNFNQGQVLETDPAAPITQWADGGCWDNIRKEMNFGGSPHYLPMKFVRYTEATNGWTDGELPQFVQIPSHANDDHHACNPTNGDIYLRHYDSYLIEKYSSATRTWSYLPSYSQSAQSKQVGNAMEYFPERGELLLVDGDWGVHRYSFATNTWSRVAYTNNEFGSPSLIGMGSYQVFAEYNNVHKFIVFGGGQGSKKLWKYDIDGNITALTDAPIGLGVGRSVFQHDPVGGHYLVLHHDLEDGKTFWDYDAENDSWTAMDANTIPWFPLPSLNPSIFNTVGIPIPEYGVIMFIHWFGVDSGVYLYKHNTPSDFTTRCAAPGVVRCVGFDASAEIAGTWGVNPVGSQAGSLTAPSIDTAVKSSGAGSLHFVIPTNSGDNSSGSVFVNFSDDYLTQFGEGQEFYVQFRQRFSQDFLNTVFQVTSGEGGWKQAIVGEGSSPGKNRASCTTLEIVVQNTALLGMPQGYHSCGFWVPFSQINTDPAFPLYYYKVQNAIPSPYCFTQQAVDPCMAYEADEWMTFQMHVQIGNWNQPNSRIEYWVSRDGGAEVKIIDMQNFNLCPDSGGSCATENQRYGQVWLLPYHTNKDATQVHPQGDVWYDELIISTNKIANPGGGVASQVARKFRSRGKAVFNGNVRFQ